MPEEDKNRIEDILQKYQVGFTFEEIGQKYNLTRERIRQIVNKGLLYEIDRMLKNGDNVEINDFINQKKSEHMEKMKKRHGIVKKIIVKKVVEKKWSKYYDYCRKCGTKAIKHAANGYCKWCYTKSDGFKKIQKESRIRNISKWKIREKKYLVEYYKRPEVIAKQKRRADLKYHGGNREKALLRDGYKCQICGITQEESYKKYNKDLYVDHKSGISNDLANLITKCRGCHNITTTEKMRKRLREVKIIIPEPLDKYSL